MLIPAVCVRIILDGGSLLERLEAGYVGLGWRITRLASTIIL